MLVVEEEAWSVDRMTFRVRALGQVAAGSVDVADDHVQLEVTFPWLLHKFAQVVQQTIARRREKITRPHARGRCATKASEKRALSRSTHGSRPRPRHRGPQQEPAALAQVTLVPSGPRGQ